MQPVVPPELERWGMQEEDKAAWDQMDRIMEKSEMLKNMQKGPAEQGDDPGDRWLCSGLYLAGACSASA